MCFFKTIPDSPFSRLLSFGVNVGTALMLGKSVYHNWENVSPLSIITNVWFYVLVISLVITLILYRMNKKNLIIEKQGQIIEEHTQKIHQLEIDDVKQMTENKYLRTKVEEIKKQEQEREKLIQHTLSEVAELRNEKLIPFFKGKFSMHLTHAAYNLSEIIDNPVELYSLNIQNSLLNKKGFRRDSVVTMFIDGVVLSDSHCFRFTFTGETSVKYNDINLKAKDLNTLNPLPIRLSEHGIDGIVKDFTLFYNPDGTIKKRGERISIEISWIWPNMLDVREDFITISNFYADKTDNISLSLRRNKDQLFETVSIYKYTPVMDEPEYITDIIIDKKTGVFTHIVNTPEKNMTYLMYYNELSDK